MILMSVTGVNMGNMALLLEHPRRGLLEHPRRGLLEHPRTGLAGESTERNDHDSFAMFGWPLAIKTRKIKNVDYFTKGVYTFVVGCRLPAGIMHQSKVFPFLDHSWVHNHV